MGQSDAQVRVWQITGECYLTNCIVPKFVAGGIMVCGCFSGVGKEGTNSILMYMYSKCMSLVPVDVMVMSPSTFVHIVLWFSDLSWSTPSLIQLISSLVETGRPEMGVSDIGRVGYRFFFFR